MHYYVYDRPAGTVSSENPARFTWMPQAPDEGPYRIEVDQDGQRAYTFDGIEYNFYTPSHTMRPGAYRYRVYAGDKEIVSENAFEIAPNAVETPLRGRSERYQGVTSHPRIWLNEDDLPQARQWIQGELKAEWEAFMRSGVAPWLSAPVKPEPLPYPNNIRVIPLWRQMYTDCQEALYAVKHCAVAWRLTGDEACLAAAKRWLLALAGWDVNGPTARSYNDESAFRVTAALAWGYDWLHGDLTQAERDAVKAALLLRGRELFHYVKDQIRIHVKLLDSHGVRSLSMTLVPAALALLHEEPEAEAWLNYTIEYFFCIFTPWGGEDGGWAEGPTYWQSGMSFFAEAISLIRKATGLDVFKRPFFTNTGDFILNTYCQDTRFMGFGDMSDLGDYPGLKAGYTMRILSAASTSPNTPYYAWYFERAKERGKGTEHMFYNYGWWNFDFDEIFFRLMYRHSAVRPVPPPDGLMVKCFHDIGWAVIHKDMAHEERHLAFQFKSSPYGSVSHSHGDQNAFVLHAFGEPLAIQSGYYIGFWSQMHMNWRRHTKSKNAVTIDGVGQFAELRKTTKAEEMNGSAKSQYDRLIAAKGRLEACERHDRFVYLRGDATQAFRETVPELRKNKRHILFVDETFFVIIDEISLDREARIDWRLHGLHPFTLLDNAARMEGERAGMQVIFGQEMALEQTDVFDGVDESETQGLARQWHLCATTAEARREHRLATVLYPYALGKELTCTLRCGETISVTCGGHTFVILPDGDGYTMRSTD